MKISVKSFAQFLSSVLVAAIVLSSCASEHRSREHTERVSHVKSVRHASNLGTVSRIDIVTREARGSGGGAILGAVIGGVVGHQIGGGRGNDIATGAGAIGGAIAGNKIEKRRRAETEFYRVTVRMDNGDKREFDYNEIDDLDEGDRVKVEGGELYRYND